MANNSIQLSLIPQKNNADGSDRVISFSVISNADVSIPISNLFTNSALLVSNLVLMESNTPVNSVQNTTPGQIWWDNQYLYIGISNNVIKRVALSPF